MRCHIDAMTPKQRLLAAIEGKALDRLPWSPFLAYYWESLPRGVQDAGQLRYLEELGADPMLRGSHEVWAVHRENCEIRETCKGMERRVTYETPVGTLRETYRRSDEGNTSFLTEHPVKTREDFKVLAYINEHTSVAPALDEYDSKYNEIGERALLMPLIGSEGKTCFQSMVEHWVGTQELVYALADYPEDVEECLAAMRRVSLQTVAISVQSKAEAYIFWEDSSTTNISPAYFEKYTLPEINAWGSVIHDAGKLLMHHACGHLRALLPLMAASQIDAVESISPPPTGNIELWEARRMLPDTIAQIGGIEPTVFLNSTLRELELYVLELMERMKGSRFVLANSDSCPPGVSLEKFRLVSDMVRRG